MRLFNYFVLLSLWYQLVICPTAPERGPPTGYKCSTGSRPEDGSQPDTQQWFCTFQAAKTAAVLGLRRWVQHQGLPEQGCPKEFCNYEGVPLDPNCQPPYYEYPVHESGAIHQGGIQGPGTDRVIFVIINNGHDDGVRVCGMTTHRGHLTRSPPRRLYPNRRPHKKPKRCVPAKNRFKEDQSNTTPRINGVHGCEPVHEVEDSSPTVTTSQSTKIDNNEDEVIAQEVPADTEDVPNSAQVKSVWWKFRDILVVGVLIGAVKGTYDGWTICGGDSESVISNLAEKSEQVWEGLEGLWRLLKALLMKKLQDDPNMYV